MKWNSFLLAYHGQRAGHHVVSWRCAEQGGQGRGGGKGEGGARLRECGPVVDEPRRTGVGIGGGEVGAGQLGGLRCLLLLLVGRRTGGTGEYWGAGVNYSLVIEVAQVSL